MAVQPDDLELIALLTEGSFEKPLWNGFLAKLRVMSDAQYALLTFRSPGRGYNETVSLISGIPRFETYDENPGRFPPGEPPFDETLTEGRPYALAELLEKGNLETKIYGEFISRNGIGSVRLIRVQEASGVYAWLSIVRVGDKDFDDSHDALLRMLAPFLRATMRHHIALERERFTASLTTEAIRGLFGWLLLDRTGNILDCDEQGIGVLAQSGVIQRTASGRLAARSAELERKIYRALSEVTDNPQARPRALTLNRDPWLDMLIVPARRKSISAKATPAAVAYVHGDSWRATDRREQLAQLFSLSAGEARLALALCRGMTIAEAATEFGLAVGTARNYCKSIFAKTGARGQPDLVRIIMRSVLAIGPDI